MEETKVAPKINAVEKSLLLRLVQKYKPVLESKVTNGYKPSDKNKEWHKLQLEWMQNLTPQLDPMGKKIPQSLSVRPRTWEQLKRSWANAKSRAKKEDTEDRRQRFATGGGPQQKNIISAESIEIKNMLAKQFSPLHNPFDDDYIDVDNDADVNQAEGSNLSQSGPVTAAVVVPASPVVLPSSSSSASSATNEQGSKTKITGKGDSSSKYLNSVPNAPLPPPRPGTGLLGAKRKAQEHILQNADEEHKERLLVIQEEKKLAVSKTKAADLEVLYWEAKLAKLREN